MKKIVYILATGAALMTTSCGVSIPTSPAETLASSDKPNFAEARNLATKDRENPQYADKAHAWFASGNVEHLLFNSELTKMILPTEKADTAKMYDALLNEVPYFEEAYKLDQKVNKEGKVVPRFANKIKEILSSDYKYFINAGYYFLQKNNYKQAYKAFDNYITVPELPLFKNVEAMHKQDSTLMDAKYLAIASAYQDKMYKDVETLANKYKDMKYNQDNIYQMLASSYAAQGDTTKFLEILKEGAAKFNNPYYLGNIVNIYSIQNKIEQAIEYLQKAIDSNPKNPVFLSAMGSLYERKDDYKQAGEWYKKIIALEPNNFDGNYNYARSLYNQAVTLLSADKIDKLTQDKAKALYQESLPYFEKAYKINPKQAYYVLSVVYNALGMTDKYKEIMDANK